MPVTVPKTDQRAKSLRHLDQTFALPHFRTRKEWEARARELRTHILAVNGLLPMPPCAPLRAQVFDTTEHADYSVSKVFFQSHPGFLVTGNLFLPRGRSGPFPAVLNPHGHWAEGRLVNTDLGTILGRGITFARQGYAAFCYDMIGYNDSTQVVHRQESDLQRLWGLGQMSLQLYNSMRAVDFLFSLPEVDPKRIACTGASGGGTQTFMLMAADPRISVAAPVNMVSAYMQGGCVCENAPSLRLDTTNPEIAATMAPRPLLLVSAAGDWTRHTPKVEYPFIRSVYRLYGAADRVECVRFRAEHNYNLDSRSAVYRFFGKWLLGETDPEALTEKPYRMDSKRTYLVFSGRTRPRWAPAGDKLFDKLARQRRRQTSAMLPTSKQELRDFQNQVGPAMSRLLAASVPDPKDVRAIPSRSRTVSGVSVQEMVLTRPAVGDRIPAALLRPTRARQATAVLVVSDKGIEAFSDGNQPAHPLVARLLGKGRTVLLIDPWGIGKAAIPAGRDRRAAKISQYLTYNRSDDAQRIQDILTALGYLRSLRAVSRIELVGLGCAGPWALFARTQAPFVRRTVVDMQTCRLSRDADFTDHLHIPAIRSIGDVLGAIGLIAPSPLCLLRPRAGFDTDAARRIYSAAGKPDGLCLHEKIGAEFQIT